MVAKLEDLNKLKEKLRDKETFNLNILVKNEKNKNRLSNIITYINESKLENNEITYYLCENKTCKDGENDLNKVNL